MAVATSIAAATVAIGGSVAKGFLASDAASDAARAAGRLRTKQAELEKESVARLEANFYDAVRATTDVYDKQLQLANQQGSQILEAAQEGDQRGVGATAGKVKQVMDATSGAIADKYADQKLQIDMKRAEASEKDASEIAGLFDDRAAAAGVKADALTQQADQLQGQATGAFIDAGVSALSAGVTAFGGLGGSANKMGKAADALSKSSGIDRAAALKQIEGLGLDRKGLNGIIKSGALPSVSTTTAPVTSAATNPIVPDVTTPTSPADVKTISIGGANLDLNMLLKDPQVQAAIQQQKQTETNAVSDFMGMVDFYGSGNRFSQIMGDIFTPYAPNE
jgi:hypothetical protein|tara:strand:- start:5892 stop:6899 length:1008 start_codon:yes stop_codon:yes gene_type:complete